MTFRTRSSWTQQRSVCGTVWKSNPPTVRTVQRVSSLRAVMGGVRGFQGLGLLWNTLCSGKLIELYFWCVQCSMLYQEKYTPVVCLCTWLFKRQPPTFGCFTLKSIGSIVLLFFFSFWSGCTACEILVPWPGIEPGPSAVKEPSPNHWTTREFPNEPWILRSSTEARLQRHPSSMLQCPLLSLWHPPAPFFLIPNPGGAHAGPSLPLCLCDWMNKDPQRRVYILTPGSCGFDLIWKESWQLPLN